MPLVRTIFLPASRRVRPDGSTRLSVSVSLWGLGVCETGLSAEEAEAEAAATGAGAGSLSVPRECWRAPPSAEGVPVTAPASASGEVTRTAPVVAAFFAGWSPAAGCSLSGGLVAGGGGSWEANTATLAVPGASLAVCLGLFGGGDARASLAGSLPAADAGGSLLAGGGGSDGPAGVGERVGDGEALSGVALPLGAEACESELASLSADGVRSSPTASAESAVGSGSRSLGRVTADRARLMLLGMASERRATEPVRLVCIGWCRAL